MRKRSSFSKFNPMIFFFVLIAFATACGGLPEVSITPVVSDALSPTDMPTQIPTNTSTPTPTPLPGVVLLREIGKGQISRFVRSEDGSVAAFVIDDIVRWYDTSTGEELGFYEPEWSFADLYFSSDGEWLVVSSRVQVLINTRTGEVHDCCGMQGNHPGMGYSISSDNQYGAYQYRRSTSGSSLGEIAMFKVSDGRSWLMDLDSIDSSMSRRVTYPAFSPDVRWLAAGYHSTYGDFLYIWDIDTQEIHLHLPQSAEIQAVAFTPDGQLAVGSEDKIVRFFDPVTGNLLKTVRGFRSGYFTELKFHNNGTQMQVSYFSETGELMDLTTNQIQSDFLPTADPFYISKLSEGYIDGLSRAVSFSPMPNLISTAWYSIQLWDFQTGELVHDFDIPHDYVHDWTFSPDGTVLAAITNDDGVMVWDTASGELLITQLDGSEGQCPGGFWYPDNVVFSPDGTQLAFGLGSQIQIWDLQTHSQIKTLRQNSSSFCVSNVYYSAAGDQLTAVINKNEIIQTWDLESEQLVSQIEVPLPDESEVYVLNSTDKILVNTHHQSENVITIQVWDLETVEMREIAETHHNIEFFLLNRGLLLSMGDGIVSIWDLQTGVLVNEWVVEDHYFRMSPDGQLLFTIGDQKIHIWALETGRLLDEIDFEGDFIGLSFDADQPLFAIGMDDKFQIWDMSALIGSLGE